MKKIEKKIDRYFDRTWILVPSGADGQPRIVNDMLHLRNPKNAESPVFTPEVCAVLLAVH